MILHSIQISCANESEPAELKHFTWHSGDEVFSVERAIAKLQEWVDQQKTPLVVSTSPDNNTPLAII